MIRTVLFLLFFLFFCSYAFSQSYGQSIDSTEFAESVREFKVNFYREVNKFRVAHFRKPLKVSAELEQQSQEWISERMGKRMHHDPRLGETAEVLTTSSNPLQAWKDSKPHRKIILARDVSSIGFAFDYGSRVSCARLR